MHIRVTDRMKSTMRQLVDAIQAKKFFRPTIGEAAEYAVDGMLEVLTKPAELTKMSELQQRVNGRLIKTAAIAADSEHSLIPKKQTSPRKRAIAKKARRSGRAPRAARSGRAPRQQRSKKS